MARRFTSRAFSFARPGLNERRIAMNTQFLDSVFANGLLTGAHDTRLGALPTLAPSVCSASPPDAPTRADVPGRSQAAATRRISPVGAASNKPPSIVGKARTWLARGWLA